MFKLISKTLLLTLCLSLMFVSGAFAVNSHQAPMLQKRVENGNLPPLEERIPDKDNVFVVHPVNKVGTYGGTIRTTSIRPEDYGDDTVLSCFPNPVQPNADASKMIPHVAKKVVSSKDKKTWTIYLRKGMKWSDGYPFTADDVMFWYNDILLNEELTPVVGQPWKVDGKLVQVKKIDDYTVEFKFPVPKPYFENRMVHMGAWDLFQPAHYLKQFHPKYTDKDKLTKMAKENQFDHWYQLFSDRNRNIWGMPITKDRPTLTPYVLVKKASDRRVYERNPYFWKVDTEGNQLPYVDRIETTIATDVEVAQGMILSGEVDFACMQTDIRNYPMYKKYEDKGNFRTILWESGMGSDVIYMVNLTHKDPVLRKIFQDVRFRRALSLGINREEINNTIYFGKAIPRQHTVLDSSKYFEPKFATSYTEYNPEKAKQLLDEMGLKDTDGDGIRERSDGKPLTFTIEYFAIETPKQPNVELVSQHWRKLGINVKTKAVSGELQGQRAPANMMDATLWHGDKATDVLFPVQAQFFTPQPPGWERTIWPQWGRWFQTEGESGDEPPAQIKELYGWWEDMMNEPDDQKRIELGKKILQSQADNLWVIGTVGKTPYPIVLNKSLRNFSDHGLGCWDTLWSMTHNPSQLFFEK